MSLLQGRSGNVIFNDEAIAISIKLILLADFTITHLRVGGVYSQQI